MIFYSSKNDILDTDKYMKYDTGGNSVIYKKENEDVLFKVYKVDSTYKYHMAKRNFNMMKEYDIPNLVKLLDYYFQYKQKANAILPMDAYTMKLVDGNRVDLIDMDKNYINQVLLQLEEIIDRLTERKLLIGDAHKDNIIFNENGVTLIDLDQITHMSLFTKKTIYSFNKSGLLYIMSTKIRSEIKEKYPELDVLTPNFYYREDSSFYNDCSILLEEQKVIDSVKKHSYVRNMK